MEGYWVGRRGPRGHRRPPPPAASRGLWRVHCLGDADAIRSPRPRGRSSGRTRCNPTVASSGVGRRSLTTCPSAHSGVHPSARPTEPRALPHLLCPTPPPPPSTSLRPHCPQPDRH
eukprot:6173202-Pleurochrysis_carterae.AAC.3